MPKLDRATIAGARPGKADIHIWDADIKGFGLCVYKSGVKAYVYQYRTPEDRTRRGVLGKVGPDFTLDQAIKKAKEWRRKIEDGGDPLCAIQSRKEALTVGEVLDLWVASAHFAEHTTETQSTNRGRILRHLKPTLGRHFVDRLGVEDCRKAFAAIRDGKTACDIKSDKPRGRITVRGGEGAARMAIRVLRSALKWAVIEGLAKDNPARLVNIGKDGERHILIRDKQEYAGLFRALDEMEQKHEIRAQAADAIRLVALTGARRNEIAALRWQYVDASARVLRLPPSAHKTGKHTGRDRVIGLPAAALAILAKQPQGEPEDLVFAPSKGEGVISLSPVWRKVRTKAKLPAGMVLHGLRHSMASLMAVQGAQAAQIMAALGHSQLSTAQRYIDLSRDARADLAELHTQTISAALTGAEPAKVLPLRKNKTAVSAGGKRA